MIDKAGSIVKLELRSVNTAEFAEQRKKLRFQVNNRLYYATVKACKRIWDISAYLEH